MSTSKLIEAAQNATETVMGEVYQIPARYRYAPLEGLFADLLAYVRRREVSIRESVMLFFDELFPLVFHYQLEDSSRTEMSEDYRECLMESRQQLTPRPFGDVPHQVTHQLTRALQFPPHIHRGYKSGNRNNKYHRPCDLRYTVHTSAHQIAILWIM